MPSKTSQDLQQDMQKSEKNRTAGKQRHLHASHDTQITALATQLDIAIAEGNRAQSNLHNSHLDRLQTLIETKAQLELEIWASILDIKACYGRIRDEFDAIVEGRLEDVRLGIEMVESLEVEVSEETGDRMEEEGEDRR